VTAYKYKVEILFESLFVALAVWYLDFNDVAKNDDYRVHFHLKACNKFKTQKKPRLEVPNG
jgi:hypothetical protein